MLVHALLAALALCPVQQEVLSATADRIESSYLSKREGALIASEVRRWNAMDRYEADCGSADAFAAGLERDLRQFDGHFLVEVQDPQAPADDWLTVWRAAAPSVNAGVREVSVLEGNVGYLRLTSFYPWDLARPKLFSAFELLSDVSGLILDLRHNGGGDGDTAGQLLRALMPLEINSVMWIEKRETRTSSPLPEPGSLRTTPSSIPIVVLIDRRSGSAAEAVAYALQSHGRAKIVGDRSGGVAHMLGDAASMPHGFSLGVPEARPVDMKTGGNWERTGVTPDVRGGDDPLFIARQMLGSR